ncbi:MAG: hypothetical protein ND895_04750, partial [Pyrinomonadaceae bacterium]|nr:hypothetical protein [Pyrinomonadaceae bacterium]
MGENKTKHKLQRAIDRFMDPEVNYQVMLASSPAAAKLIIEALPGVRDLVELGPEAGKAALNLLQREDSPDDYRISAVALYILERHPSPEAKLAL